MGLRSRDVYPYLPQSPSLKSIIQVGSLFPLLMFGIWILNAQLTVILFKNLYIFSLQNLPQKSTRVHEGYFTVQPKDKCSNSGNFLHHTFIFFNLLFDFLYFAEFVEIELNA